MRTGHLLPLILIPHLLLAQSDPYQLERRLSGATGRQQLEILAQLTTEHRHDEPGKAITFGERALDLLPSMPDRELELEVASSLLHAYVRSKRYEDALRSGARAQRLAQVENDKSKLAYVLGNSRSRESSATREARSTPSPTSASPTNREETSTPPRGTSAARSRSGRGSGTARRWPRRCSSWARWIASEESTPGRSRTCADPSRSQRKIDARADVQDCYLELSETYAEMGRYREAYEAFRQYQEIHSEIFSERNRELLAEMEARFDADRKAKKIEILRQQQAIDELEIARHGIVRRALIGGLVLSLAVLLVLYNRYRLKLRSAHAIERKNVELRESEERYHRLFEDPGSAELVLDAGSGEILDANGTVSTLLGRPVSDLLSRTSTTVEHEALARILELAGNDSEDAASFLETFPASTARPGSSKGGAIGCGSPAARRCWSRCTT